MSRLGALLAAAGLLLASASLWLLAVAVPAAAQPKAKERGALLSAKRLAAIDRSTSVSELAPLGVEPDEVRYGATPYRIAYRTVDPHRRPRKATALVAIPRPPRGPLPLAVYGHGTVSSDDLAPSRLQPDEGRPVAELFAGAGFVTVAPDYLGLGGGPGYHPYLHAASEASATLDAVRAARRLVRRLRGKASDRVYLSGYSQGAQMALALSERLHRRPRGLRLRAVGAVAGPYDVEAAVRLAAAAPGGPGADLFGTVYYLARILVSYDRVYALYGNAAEAFREPYARVVGALFDGARSDAEVAAALPESPAELLQPQWLELARNPRGPLAKALAANRVCAFRSRVPTRLLFGERDVTAPPAQAQGCLERIVAAGGRRAKAISLGPADHVPAGQLGVPETARWFAARARLRSR